MVVFGLSALLFSSLELSLYTTLLGLQGAQGRLGEHAHRFDVPICEGVWPSIFWHCTLLEN